MGKVYVGEFGFDSLAEAQDYAKKLKADPNYVPPVKEEVGGSAPAYYNPEEPGQEPTEETSVNDGFIPQAAQNFEGTQPSEASEPESNTVVVETGLEFETKELTDQEKFDKELADLEAEELTDEELIDTQEVANAESDIDESQLDPELADKEERLAMEE